MNDVVLPLQFGLGDVGPKVAKAFVDFVVQGLSGSIVQELIDVGLVPFLKVPNPSDSPGANAAWKEVFEVSMAVFPILVAAGLMATPFGEDGERDLWRQGFRVVTVVFLIAISRPVLGLAIDVTNAITIQLAPTSYTIGVGKGTFDGLGTFFLTANAYLVAAIVMLLSTAMVAILLTLRHVIVLFVYIGLPFLAVCWYADWGPMSAVSGFATKVMRMGIYALLVGPLLSIALRALEVISENGLVVAAGNDSLAVLWESLLIAALGPLMLVFITWKLVSWAGEPMGFGAVTNAAAGVTQTALTVAAAGAGAAAGVGGAAGGGVVSSGASGGGVAASGGSGAGMIGGSAGSSGSVFGSTAASGPDGVLGSSGAGASGGAGSPPSPGSSTLAGRSGGVGIDSHPGEAGNAADGMTDGPTAGKGPSESGATAAGVPGPGSAAPGQGMAADGGREPLIARSPTTPASSVSPSSSSAPSAPSATGATPTGHGTTGGVGGPPPGPPTGDVLDGLGGDPGTAGSRHSGALSANSLGSVGDVLSTPATDSIDSLLQSGPLGGAGGSSRARGVSTALSLATGQTSVDQVLANQIEGTAGNASSGAGGAGASASESSDDSGALSGSVVSKTATTFTMNQGSRVLRKGATVAKGVGSDVAGAVADEPSRAVGGALGGAAGSSVGGPVGTAVGTVVGSEAARVGMSAVLEYGYKQAYERARGIGLQEMTNRGYQKVTGWFADIRGSLRDRGVQSSRDLNKGTARNGQLYSDVKGEK